MVGQKPLSKFKAGQVSAALWENQVQVKGKTVTMLKATVQRRYKDKGGDWKSSQSFSALVQTGSSGLHISPMAPAKTDSLVSTYLMMVWLNLG